MLRAAAMLRPLTLLLLVGEADVLPEPALDVDAGLLDDCLCAGRAGEEPGKGQGVGELAVGGGEVGVRWEGGAVDRLLGGGERAAVEGCEPGDDGGDEGIELGVGQGA